MRLALVVLILVSTLAPAAAHAADPVPASSAPDSRAIGGKQIYTQGRSPRETPILATIAGGVEIPAHFHPCASCHGSDGRGGAEGGLVIPKIWWSHLQAPHGVPTHLGGLRPPYTPATIGRAIRWGLDSAGTPLDELMPRYDMSDADLGDLLAYLEVIEREQDPGVTTDSIRIGSVLPLSGANGRSGAALAALLQRRFAAANATAGINGRRIEYVARDAGTTTASALAATRALLDEPGGVFCMVANAGPGAAPRVLALLTERGVPVIGPLGFDLSAPNTGTVFYLLPSLDDQARAGALFLARHLEQTSQPVAVVHGPGTDAAGMADALTHAAEREGLRVLTSSIVGHAEVPGLVASLRRDRPAWLVLFMSAVDGQTVLDAAAAADWTPPVLASFVLLGDELESSGRIVLLAPPLLSPRDIAEPHHALPPDTPGADSMRGGDPPAPHPGKLQLAGLAAGQLLVSTIEAVGRDLHRERLLEHLRAVHDFETGVMPPITFGPNRRRGIRGALLLSKSPGSPAEQEWIDLGD